jgi:hypothetical protein
MKIIFNSRLARLLPRRFIAITIAEWILIKNSVITSEKLKHEQRHVTHWRACGYVLFPLAYLIGWVLGGFSYHRNWFERDARRHEKIISNS